MDACVVPITPPGLVIPPKLVTSPAIAAPKDVAISCTVVTDDEVRSSSPFGESENTFVSKCGQPIPMPIPMSSRNVHSMMSFIVNVCKVAIEK